jgi:hypothetical protein
MAEHHTPSQSPHFTWANIATTLMLAVTLAAAGWTIFQTQFSNVEKTATADRIQTAHDIAELKTNFDKYLTTAEHKAYIGGIADQLSGISLRLVSLETTLTAIQPRLAHDPVEDRTFQATVIASDKRIDLIQAQIQDINRQIAAALIIIDSNAGTTRKVQPTLPP